MLEQPRNVQSRRWATKSHQLLIFHKWNTETEMRLRRQEMCDVQSPKPPWFWLGQFRMWNRQASVKLQSPDWKHMNLLSVKRRIHEVKGMYTSMRKQYRYHVLFFLPQKAAVMGGFSNRQTLQSYHWNINKSYLIIRHTKYLFVNNIHFYLQFLFTAHSFIPSLIILFNAS